MQKPKHRSSFLFTVHHFSTFFFALCVFRVEIVCTFVETNKEKDMKKVAYLSDLKEGEKFEVPSLALPNGFKRTYIFTQHVRVNTLTFKEVGGNGMLKLPERAQFKLIVERVY